MVDLFNAAVDCTKERFFDGWSRVIAARLFLLMHLFIATRHCQRTTFNHPGPGAGVECETYNNGFYQLIINT